MRIERAQLPKGMSYPLRSSLFAEALSSAGVSIDTHLIIAPSKIFFDAFFWPPNANVAHERLYVRTAAVPAAEARAARAFIETSVVPEMIKWLCAILALPQASPQRHHEHRFHRAWSHSDSDSDSDSGSK